MGTKYAPGTVTVTVKIRSDPARPNRATMRFRRGCGCQKICRQNRPVQFVAISRAAAEEAYGDLNKQVRAPSRGDGPGSAPHSRTHIALLQPDALCMTTGAIQDMQVSKVKFRTNKVSSSSR